MKQALRNAAVGVFTFALLAGGGAAALVTGELPAAQAAPPVEAAAPTAMDILPPPQSASTTGVPVSLAGNVTVATGANPDAAVQGLVERIIAGAGGTATFVPSDPAATIYLGTVADNPAVDTALQALGSQNATALAAGGHVIATGAIAGKPTLVLNGKDAAGTFYAAQSMDHVVANGTVPAMTVRDWPLMSIRGGIEGFYGIPWSHEARLDQLRFYGKHKMNTYIYTPKDDNYLRARWRELYPASELAKLKELVDEAKANHVDFIFALSPGNNVCYSAENDFAATVAKFDQLRAIGVTSFYIALDDINPVLNCAADQAKFTSSGFRKLADGQAFYLNRLVKDYIQVHGLKPLHTVPTNYNGSGEDPYKDQFGLATDDSIVIQWTGEGVFSNTITEASVIKAVDSYNAEHFYIWDNLPVNDGQRGRLFLNPLEGRDPNLYKHIEGITSNPMIEAYASMIALAGFADYSWNGPAYDAQTTQGAIINELAGPDPAVRLALETFVDLNQSWKPYRPDSQTAPALSADVAAFWQAFDAGDVAGMQPLQERLAIIEGAPAKLATMAMTGFYDDSKPWIDAAAQWAAAMGEHITMLTALEAGEGVAATDSALAASALIAQAKMPTVPDLGPNNIGTTPNVIVPSVGDGVFEAFTAAAEQRYNDWLALVPVTTAPQFPGTATATLPTYGNNVPGNMTDGDPATLWWSSQPAATGTAVTLDLGAVQPVGKIVIQQADSDLSSGDMIYNGQIEHSVDGATWVPAGAFPNQSRIEKVFEAPVDARYIRLVATAPNPGGQWIKIREFQAFAATEVLSTNMPALNNTGLDNAFDVSVGTAFEAAAVPGEEGHVTRMLEAPEAMKSVTVVGQVAGTLQVQSDGEWRTVGALDPTVSFQEARLDEGLVSGVRIALPADAPQARAAAQVLHELGLRNTAAVGNGPFIGEAAPPAPEPEPQPEPQPEPGPVDPAPGAGPGAGPGTDPGAAPGADPVPGAGPGGAAGAGTGTGGIVDVAAGDPIVGQGGDGGGLATTGATSVVAAAAGIMLLLLGMGLVLARNRVRRA